MKIYLLERNGIVDIKYDFYIDLFYTSPFSLILHI